MTAESPNIFALVLDKVRAANYGAGGRRASCPPASTSRGSWSSRRAIPPMATWPPTPRWCWPRTPARSRATWPRRSPAKLRADPLIEKVEVAGPGFINLTLKPAAWTAELRAVLAAGADYGRSALGQAEPVNVEYVSANPTGPMHVGHCRGAVFGDALANLLASPATR